MFNILNREGDLIDTATSFNEASRVVAYLDSANVADGPHFAVNPALIVPTLHEKKEKKGILSRLFS